MNILFINDDADPPYFGGTTTVTNLLANELRARGHNCMLAYLEDFEHPSKTFSIKIKLEDKSREKIKLFAQSHNIDIILNQQKFMDYTLLDEFKERGAKIVYIYHSRPMVRYDSRSYLINNYLIKGKTFKRKIAGAIFGSFYHTIYRPVNKHLQQGAYRNAYNASDVFLLLSNGYYHCLEQIIPNINKNKVRAIGNPVVFSDFISPEDLKSKKKQALVVGRLTKEKNIDEILTIWGEVEKDSSFSDWELVIVGGGDGYDEMLNKIEELGLKRVKAEGYQSPIKYYKDASIFLMTSKWEGWPMTLMECQQYGVVPICYDSFEAVFDIIINKRNGFIIKYGDRINFLNHLEKIMADTKLRGSMAKSAIEYAKSHTVSNYADEFEDLFKQLNNDTI